MFVLKGSLSQLTWLELSSWISCCVIPGHLGPGTLGPYTASIARTSQDVPVYPRTSWTWDPGTLHCLHGWDIPGYPRTSWTWDLGNYLTLPPWLGHPSMSLYFLGHLGPGTLGPCLYYPIGWDIPGCPGISQDILDLGPYTASMARHPRMSRCIPGHLGPGTLGPSLHCLHDWDIPGCPGISQDILDLGPWDPTLPPWLGHPRMSRCIPGHLGPGTLGPWDLAYTASMTGTSQDVLVYPRTSWTWDPGNYLTLPPWLGHPRMSLYFLGHLGPGTLGPSLYYPIGWDIPGCPGISHPWTWDLGT